MKPALWFRIAAVLLLLFAAGHTAGFLSFTPASPEARSVRALMDRTFTEGGSTFSYAAFYTGFALFITTTQIFFAWLAWRLASLVQRSPADARAIASGLLLLQIAGGLLAARFFSAPPVVFSAAIALCFAMALVSLHRAGPPATQGSTSPNP